MGKALGRLGDAYPKLDWAPRFLRARTTLQAFGKESGEAYAEAVGVTPPALRSRLYSQSMRTALQGHRAEARYVQAMKEAPANNPLSRAQSADLKIWLPGAIPTNVATPTIAASLEAPKPP